MQMNKLDRVRAVQKFPHANLRRASRGKYDRDCKHILPSRLARKLDAHMRAKRVGHVALRIHRDGRTGCQCGGGLSVKREMS